MVKENVYTCGLNFLLLMKTGTFPITVLYKDLAETNNGWLTIIQI